MLTRAAFTVLAFIACSFVLSSSSHGQVPVPNPTPAPLMAEYCTTARCDVGGEAHSIKGKGRTRAAAKQDAMDQAAALCQGYTLGCEIPCPVENTVEPKSFIPLPTGGWVVCAVYRYCDGECIALKFEGNSECDAYQIARDFFRDFYDPCRPACLRMWVIQRPGPEHAGGIGLPVIRLTCHYSVYCPSTNLQYVCTATAYSQQEAEEMVRKHCEQELCAGGGCNLTLIACFDVPQTAVAVMGLITCTPQLKSSTAFPSPVASMFGECSQTVKQEKCQTATSCMPKCDSLPSHCTKPGWLRRIFRR